MKARFNQRNWCAHEIDTLHIPCLRVYLGDDAGFYFIYTGSFTLDSCLLDLLGVLFARCWMATIIFGICII